MSTTYKTASPTLELVDSYGQHYSGRSEFPEILPGESEPKSSYLVLSDLMALAEQHQARVTKETKSSGLPSESLPKNRIRKHYYGGGYIIDVQEIIRMVFLSGTALIPFFTFAQPLLKSWLQNRATRSIVFKHGSIEIRVTGSDDLNQVVEALNKLEDDKAHAEQESPKAKKSTSVEVKRRRKKSVKQKSSHRK